MLKSSVAGSSSLDSFPFMGLENTETVSSKLETLQKSVMEKLQNVLLEKELNKEADIADCNVENKKPPKFEFVVLLFFFFFVFLILVNPFVKVFT